MSVNLNDTGIVIGDYVYDMVHGYYGRVTAVHLYVELPESKDWVEGQTPPIKDEGKTPMAVWFSFLVQDGGSAVRPAYAIRKSDVEFELRNNWSSFYFGEGE